MFGINVGMGIFVRFTFLFLAFPLGLWVLFTSFSLSRREVRGLWLLIKSCLYVLIGFCLSCAFNFLIDSVFYVRALDCSCP